MKKIFTLFLLMATLLAGSSNAFAQYSGKGTFKKVTSAEEITDGSYLIVAGGLVMSNTFSSSKMLGIGISDKMSNDGLSITDPDAAYVYDITVTNGVCTIKNGENILGYDSGSKFSFTSTPNADAQKDQWTVNNDHGSLLFNNVADLSHFIFMKSGTTTSPDATFAPYPSANIGKNGYITPEIYKLEVVAGDQSYKKIKTLDELESGKTYVITGAGTNAAMNATLGGNTTKYLTQTEVTLVSDIIKTSEDLIVWTITKEADGNYSIKNGDNYAGYNGSGNSARLETEYANSCAWTIEATDGVFVVKNVAITNEDRFLQHNSNNTRFATYKTTSNQNDLNIYKVYDASGIPAELKFENGENRTVFFVAGATFDSKATTVSTSPIIYASSDEAVATIDNKGLITLKATGVTTITAKVEAKGSYQEDFVSYTLTVKNKTVDLPYEETFTESLGDWFTYTNTTKEWYTTADGVTINGYKTNTEGWLISPEVSAENLILSFTTTFDYDTEGLTVLYSSDFDPLTQTPAGATWNDISAQVTLPTETKTAVPSGDVMIKELTAPIRFAFKYICTEDAAAKVVITDLKITGNGGGAINEVEAAPLKVVNGKGELIIIANETTDLKVYAITGTLVVNSTIEAGNTVVALPAGIYIVNGKKAVVL